MRNKATGEGGFQIHMKEHWENIVDSTEWFLELMKYEDRKLTIVFDKAEVSGVLDKSDFSSKPGEIPY